MKRLTIIILLAAAAGMVSCSAVRHCKAPDVDLPERIAGEDSDSLTVADVQWWRFYGDSTLCRIIERTLDNNRDMLAAAARVERLREPVPGEPGRTPAVGYGNRLRRLRDQRLRR